MIVTVQYTKILKCQNANHFNDEISFLIHSHITPQLAQNSYHATFNCAHALWSKF